MMKLRSCCGCITVKTGTIVIGVLSLVGGIFSAIVNAINLSRFPFPPIEVMTAPDLTEPQRQAVLLVLIFKLILITGLAYGFISTILSVYLLVGVMKKIPSYIFLYVSLGFGGLVLSISMSVAILVIAAMFLPIGIFFLMTFLLVLSTALSIYLWLVVYVHYKAVFAETSGQQSNPNDGQVFPVKPMPYRNI